MHFRLSLKKVSRNVHFCNFSCPGWKDSEETLKEELGSENSDDIPPIRDDRVKLQNIALYLNMC